MLETKTKIWEKEILEKGIKKGKEEGKAEGFEKGIKETLKNTAINMIKIGETDSKIALCTGLSVEQIVELHTRIQKENR